jgi:hypothetical protein
MSGLVLAITFLAIYRQLRAQRSASAFEQLTALTDEWAAERLTRKRLAVWIAIRDGRALPDVPTDAAAAIVDFWEKVGGLVRAGHVPLPVVDGMLGNSLQMWWQVVEPFNAKARLQWMDAEIGVNFEWLAAHSTGTHPPITDPEFLSTNLGRIIATQEAALRDWEAMRSVSPRHQLRHLKVRLLRSSSPTRPASAGDGRRPGTIAAAEDHRISVGEADTYPVSAAPRVGSASSGNTPGSAGSRMGYSPTGSGPDPCEAASGTPSTSFQGPCRPWRAGRRNPGLRDLTASNGIRSPLIAGGPKTEELERLLAALSGDVAAWSGSDADGEATPASTSSSGRDRWPGGRLAC